MIERVNVANRHENISWTCPDGLRGQFALLFQVKLIKLRVGAAMSLCDLFGDHENDKESNGKTDAGECGYLLCKKIDDAEREQRQGDYSQSQRDFEVANAQIQRHAEFARPWLLVTQDQDRQSFHREAPHHAKGVSFAEHKDVAAAENDG